MKILFLVKFYPPSIGGVERHVEQVSQELIKLGHQVTILTLKHSPLIKTQENIKGVNIIRMPYCWSKWKIWQALWRFRAIIKEADIIHCHDVFFWYLPFKFFYPFKPVYTTFHGWEGKFPIPLKNIFLRKIWEKLSFGNICIGDYLVKWYKTKANFISYGAPITQLKGNLPKKVKTAIFIGRLEQDLGLKQYLEAFKILKADGWKIIFVGNGPMKSNCIKFGRVTGFVKSLKPYLQVGNYIFTSSYLTIWDALKAHCQVFCLYQNQLKQDYLESFPARKHLHLSCSPGELVNQLNQPLPFCSKFPTWQEIAKIYLQLWQKK